MVDERKPSWLQMQLTGPNIISLAALLIGLGAMWANVQARDAEHDRRLQAAEVAINKATADTSTILQAIAELRTDIRYLSRSIEQAGK